MLSSTCLVSSPTLSSHQYANHAHTVPLAVAAPAALAGLAYVNAKSSIGYDAKLVGSAIRAKIITVLAEKKDRSNLFYVLEENARGKFANNVCMIYEGNNWTYKELYDTALKYGAWLKAKHGVKSKDVVAMDFTNNEVFIFLWMGLWSIGAKPAFINYNLTAKALAHCIRVSTARIVLVDPEVEKMITQEVRDELPSVEFEFITPAVQETVRCTDGTRVADSERSETRSQNMGILIYTSGTTGLPKPAVVSWNKLSVGSNLVRCWMGLTSADIFYTVSVPHHAYERF